MFESLLNPILSPLLTMNPLWAIVLIAFVLTLGITVVYKLATDQDRMKELKKQIKDLQKKMKEKQKEGDVKGMQKIQGKMMPLNTELMKHSMKPTLYTFIPIIIIFGWLNAHMAYMQVMPDIPFEVTAAFPADTLGLVQLVASPELVITEDIQTIENGMVKWELKGPEGDYTLTYNRLDSNKKVLNSVEQKLKISTTREYEQPLMKYKKSSWIETSMIENEAIKPLGNTSLFGWRPGWLGTYILLSIIFSMLMRKAMKVV